MSTALLRVDGIAKTFDGVEALRGVSFTVARGERVALIGPNGAGKTTCFNVIDGQLAPDRGEVHLRDARVDGLVPREIAALGVGRTFQVAATFASMTVRESVAVALCAAGGRDGALVGSIESSMPQANALLARLGLGALADAHCASLAYGDAKRVELALALARRPVLLLMDEPTAGAGAAARDAVMRIVADVVRDGEAAVLFTEHDMDVVFAHADRVIVLDEGAIIAEGAPAEIRANPRVQAAYLGG
ncbi:MAG TPA: ATP-binding cassette domain-containing protein [Casimicrobiaceae bacterium]|jgi:branched-chain amino acid transport system ATP-binding protein